MKKFLLIMSGCHPKSLIFTLFILSIFLMGCGDSTEESTESEADISEAIYGVSTALDGSGNAYVVGSVYAGRDGQTAIGDADILLVKYNSQGSKQWSLISGTTESDFAEDIAATGTGNLYVTGYTYGTLSGQVSAGEVDIILMKYDSSGDLQWQKQIGTAQSDFGAGIAVDGSENVYLAGHTYGSLQGTNVGSKDLVLMKFNAAGITQWIRQLGNNEGADATLADGTYAVDLAIDSSGGVYVAGFTTSELDGNTSSGETDAFITKYGADGSKIWTTQVGSTGIDYTESVVVDSNDNVLLTGYTFGDLAGFTNVGFTDFFVIKLNSLGTVQWTQQLGTADTDYIYGVAVDQANNVYLGGHTLGSLNGDSAGGFDLILVKYDSSGTHIFSQQSGTENSEGFYGITSDGSSNIFGTGFAFKDIDSDGVVEQVLTITKYNTSGVQQWAEEL